MPRLTDVVKHLLIINVLMYFVTAWFMGGMTGNPMTGEVASMGRYQLAMFYPTSEFFQPYQIVSHMFMHADITHLFFNMFALFMFGPPLESLWGPKKFLFYYFFAGFGALGLYLLVKFIEVNYLGHALNPDIPMLGASGAVFGLLAGFGMKFPNARLMLIFPPIPMKAKYFVLIYAGIELIFGISSFPSNAGGVAHFAHVGGALFGFLLILYWQKTGKGV